MADSSTAHDDSAVVPNVNERTRLLDSTHTTTTTSYRTQVEEDRTERVVDISMEHDPTVPLDELTDHIQHFLVFGKHSHNGRLSISSSTSSSSSKNGGGDEIITGEQELSLEVEEETQNRQVSSSSAARKSRKRNLIAGALHFATDQWRERQGITSQVIQEHTGSYGTQVMPQPQAQPLGPLPLVQPHDDSVKGVWDVAKNASVCAVLGLLSERRQGKVSITADADATLQRLALSTLEHGVKQTSAKDMIRQEMLFKPWLGDKSGKENKGNTKWNDQLTFVLVCTCSHSMGGGK